MTRTRGTTVTTLRRLAAGATLVSLLALTGCGSGSDTATDPDADTGGQPSGFPSGGPGGGFDADQLKQIRTCLKAAGLDDALADLPTGMPTDRPSGMPTDMPSDLPSDMTGMPSDFPSDGPGGGMNELFSDPEVQGALDACGIDLPQAPSGAPS